MQRRAHVLDDLVGDGSRCRRFGFLRCQSSSGSFPLDADVAFAAVIIDRDPIQNVLQLFGVQVGRAGEQLAIWREKGRRGPAALVVMAVHVRATVAVHLDRDKLGVDELDHVGIGE